jgi:hypothetical protein
MAAADTAQPVRLLAAGRARGSGYPTQAIPNI